MRDDGAGFPCLGGAKIWKDSEGALREPRESAWGLRDRKTSVNTRLRLLLCDSKCNLSVHVETVIPVLPRCRADARIKIKKEGISARFHCGPKPALRNQLYFKRRRNAGKIL